MRFRAAVILLTLAGFALRAYGLHHDSFWLDEVDAISMAAEPVTQQLRKLTAVGENGPLYFIFFKGWLALAGASEYGARYASCVASTLAIPLIAALAHRLTASAAVGVTAAALAVASPFYVWYAQDAKMYPLFAALALAAHYALLRAIGRGGAGWWLGYVVASSLGLYVHLFAALQIAANTVVGVVWLLRSKQRRKPFTASTAALVLPYVPLAVWQAPVLLRGARVGYPPTPLATMLISLGERLTWHADPAPARWLLAPLGAALAWGLWCAWRRTWRAGAALLVWLTVPILLVFALQFTVPVFRDRYLVPLVAPLLILLALAIAVRPGPHSIVIAAFIVTGWLYGLSHPPQNPDYRGAAAFLRQTAGAGDRVGFLAEYAERPFGHYFGQLPGAPLEKAPLPYTNYPTTSEQEGLRAVANALRAGETLWIVRWEDWFWDARDLTGQYLRNRGARLTLERDFQGVRVARWEIP
ncbi:MAG TPA: glycosyltransferase family 39 protein [Chloroflexota bacterium]|nr:glycosyltransferase family 39 protein [Chloroflexota bacterium]